MVRHRGVGRQRLGQRPTRRFAERAGDHLEPDLVVESEPDLGRMLVEQLSADGYRAALARTAAHARALARVSSPRLAVIGDLDVSHGGLRLLEEIRASPRCSAATWDRDLPAILVAAHAHELDVLRAFDAGADDFLPGPASYLELRARMRSILRRSRCSGQRRRFEVGGLLIDLDARTVCVDGQQVAVSRTEFELLVHLAREPRRVCSRGELLRAVWGYRVDTSTRTVDGHASRLRHKLDVGGGCPFVVNIRGVGYRLL
jgi:DNA-binding response OmpR family regulator